MQTVAYMRNARDRMIVAVVVYPAFLLSFISNVLCYGGSLGFLFPGVHHGSDPGHVDVAHWQSSCRNMRVL